MCPVCRCVADLSRSQLIDWMILNQPVMMSIFKRKIYSRRHEPFSKALSKHYTVVTMYMLDYVLPQVAKLSRTLQTKQLDLSVIPSLVNATLHTLDDSVLPSAN